MDHLAIINALGGYRSVAKALDLAPIVAWRWGRNRPIPPRRWLWFVQYAKARRVAGVSLKVIAEGYFPETHPANDHRARQSSAAGGAAR